MERTTTERAEFLIQAARLVLSDDAAVGLGLTIRCQLARGMNGELEVEGVEGEGSTFTLLLPREER